MRYAIHEKVDNYGGPNWLEPKKKDNIHLCVTPEELVACTSARG